mgnify:CR=1 FL=1
MMSGWGSKGSHGSNAGPGDGRSRAGAGSSRSPRWLSHGSQSSRRGGWSIHIGNSVRRVQDGGASLSALRAQDQGTWHVAKSLFSNFRMVRWMDGHVALFLFVCFVFLFFFPEHAPCCFADVLDTACSAHVLALVDVRMV